MTRNFSSDLLTNCSSGIHLHLCHLMSAQKIFPTNSATFTCKLSTIRASLPPASTDTPLTFPEASSEVSSFRSASIEEVKQLILKTPSKSCELDPIPTTILKQCVDEIAPAITSIVNHSMASGVVSSTLKMALVRPLLKKPNLDPGIMHNYRPISNLAYLSKILEHLVFNRLASYLQTNNLLSERQSAYRPHHSVETLLARLSGHILQQMDTGRVTAAVFLDLSSAFDTINHTVVISRLSSLGVSGTALQWFKSYLTNRHQSICIKGSKSTSVPLACGVPQGSVGGPLLFSIYTSPLGQIIQKYGIQYHCYADDFQLFTSFSPLQSSASAAMAKLEACIDHIRTWMSSNYLKLNESKSTFMLFGTKNNLNKLNISFVRIGASYISPSPSCHNLGVIFDSQMNFNDHNIQFV